MNAIEITFVVLAIGALALMTGIILRAIYIATIGRSRRFREARHEHQAQKRRVDEMLDEGRSL